MLKGNDVTVPDVISASTRASTWRKPNAITAYDNPFFLVFVILVRLNFFFHPDTLMYSVFTFDVCTGYILILNK